MVKGDELNGDQIEEPSELMRVGEVAEKLRVSIRTVWRLNSSGRIPKPLRLGNNVRWRSNDIADWISDGCPAIKE